MRGALMFAWGIAAAHMLARWVVRRHVAASIGTKRLQLNQARLTGNAIKRNLKSSGHYFKEEEKTMRLPGFTAEASVSTATTGYRLKGEPSAAGSNTARVTIASCFDICIGYCGRSLVCAHSCLRLCNNIRER